MAINTEPTDEGYTILQGVNKIIELMENGAGGLPEVDDSDNGKVLTVVDGAWAAASGGGGGGVLKITMTQVEDVAYLDKTYEDIATALNQGIWPVCFDAQENDVSVYTVTEFYQEEASQGTHYYVSLGGMNFVSDSPTGTLTFS